MKISNINNTNNRSNVNFKARFMCRGSTVFDEKFIKVLEKSVSSTGDLNDLVSLQVFETKNGANIERELGFLYLKDGKNILEGFSYPIVLSSQLAAKIEPLKSFIHAALNEFCYIIKQYNKGIKPETLNEAQGLEQEFSRKLELIITEHYIPAVASSVDQTPKVNLYLVENSKPILKERIS